MLGNDYSYIILSFELGLVEFLCFLCCMLNGGSDIGYYSSRHCRWWCTDTSYLRHFGPKTFRHYCVKFLRWCWSVQYTSALFGSRH